MKKKGANMNKEIEFGCENFDEFVKYNWTELVEYAEGMTGEQYDGQEPLLTDEAVIELAQEMWDEKMGKYI